MSNWYAARKDFGDGRSGYVMPMTYGKGRLCVGETDALTFESAYCYDSCTAAAAALELFDGVGDPVGWFKNLQTGEFQPENTRQQLDPAFVPIAPTSSHYRPPVLETEPGSR